MSRKAFEKYKDNPEAYVKARRSDARGKVFEATVAHEANERFKLIGRPDRVLTSAAEGDPAHSSDNLLWKEGVIKLRYQLKSTRNAKSIIEFLSEPEYMEKYANEVIVTHPDTFNQIARELSKRKRLDGSLPPDWQRVDEAFRAGRVSDEIFPKWKVPTYYEAQHKADDVIRSQFERARREYGDDSPRPAVDVPYSPFFARYHACPRVVHGPLNFLSAVGLRCQFSAVRPGEDNY
jgi:hypothetical protein